MVSTNKAALQALQALNAATAELRRTERRVSTGLKVASAKDDGATWAIAQNMRAEISGWRVASDSLARGVSVAQTAAAGAAQIIDALAQMKQKALALSDATLDPASRSALQSDLQALVAQIDKAAHTAEFDGKKPLADDLTPVSVTTSYSSYSIPPAPLTPPSLAGALQPTAGGASQTFTRDAGNTAGRIDLFLDAYGVPDLLEIWQQGTRVAATGQAYVAGGGAVGPGAMVAGQQVLSFDYDPAQGQTLEFRFNENVANYGSAWNVGGVVLQNVTDPLPTPVTTSFTSTVMTSVATTYNFTASPKGDSEPLQAQPLTANALGLDAIDWNDPGSLSTIVDQALKTAVAAGTYFGQREQAFQDLIVRNGKIADTLQAGVGNLVDADLARESAKLQASQTRQSLAQTALAIANAAPGMLLKLFGLQRP